MTLVIAWDLRKGIPSTTQLNGVDVFSLLHNFQKINPEGISVVERLADGTFSDAKQLGEFSQKELHSCSNCLLLHGEQYARKEYSQDVVNFTKSIRDRTCYLCEYGPKQVIVVNGKDMPQDICDNLSTIVQQREKEKQRIEAFDAKYKKNIHTTWQKKQREAAAQKK